jgi:hypothetical protein
MSSETGVNEIKDNFLDDETHKEKFEQYVKQREKNMRKCHFSYRRRI